MYNYSNNACLALPIYGKHIHNLVDYILTIKDKDTRTQCACTIVTLIQKIHVGKSQKALSAEKIWQDLWIISNYKLNVDFPYPQTLKKMTVPDAVPMDYPTYKPSKYAKLYGYNIVNYIIQIIKTPNIENPENVWTRIVKTMIRLHKKHINIETIFEHIKDIVGEKFSVYLTSIKKKCKI